MDHITITAVQLYLFGKVKYLDLLALIMLLDIITGILKAIKNKRLRSRSAFYGYARKIGVFVAIITANIVDQILGIGGALTFSTLLFYLANECISILENLAQLGLKIPTQIKDKLHVMQMENEEKRPIISAENLTADKLTITKDAVINTENGKGE